MVFSLPDLVREKSIAGGTATTIQIMRGTFQPEDQKSVVECLEANGSNCTLFEGFERMADLLWDRSTKLLLVGASDDNLPRLTEVINSAGGNHSRNPILIYYKDRSNIITI